jgi:hypothetical protein
MKAYQDWKKSEDERKSREQIAKEANLSRRENQNLYAQLRADSQSALQKQRNINNIEHLQNNFNKDKLVLKANEGLNAADDAMSLLESNTPISDQAVQRSLARLSGEVGVLTDQDVAAFGGTKSISGKLAQSIEQMKSGKLTPENKQFMKEIINVFKKRREEQLDQRALLLTKQGSKRLDIDENEAYQFLRPGMTLPSNVIKNSTNQKQIIKQGYNSKTDETQLIYSDGTKEIVKGKR